VSRKPRRCVTDKSFEAGWTQYYNIPNLKFQYLHACGLYILNFNDSISSLYFNTHFYQDTTLNVSHVGGNCTNICISFHAFTVYLVKTTVFWVVILLTIMFLPTFGDMFYVLLQDISSLRRMLRWLVWGYVALICLCTVIIVINHKHRETGRQLFTEPMGTGCSKWNQYLNQTVTMNKLLILHLCNDLENHHLSI